MKKTNFEKTNVKNCSTKLVFNSFAEANGFNKRSRRHLRGNKKVEKLHAYKCLVCQQWHLGHPFVKDYKGDYRND